MQGKERSKRKEYQNSKRKVVLSVLALVVCVAMLLGTTLAWFTDSVTSGRNKIVAGDLDIEVTHQSGKMQAAEPVNIDTKLFTDVALWEPGAVEYENINIENVGNLVLKAKLQLTDVAKNAMKAEYGGYDLTTAIKVAMKEGGFTGELTRETITGDTSLTWSTFSTFEETIAQMNPGEKKTYGLALYWEPTDHDNDWNLNNGKQSTDGQPLWIEFGLNVVATQKDAEVDSFDETYDKNATYPILASVVNKTDTYSGNFAQNKIQSGSGESTQVTALQDIKLANDTSVTLIQAGTTLFKSDGTNDVPIVTSNDNQDGYPGSIIANIKTTESTSDSVTYQINYNYVEGEVQTPVSKFSNIVTNVFNMSKGLKNVKVKTTHNGEEAELTSVSAKPDTPSDRTFYYDSANGKLYIYSSTYSNFRVTFDYDHAAAVNGQGYSTLDEALAAAKSGETVVILKNIITTKSYVIDKNVVMDLNGKTISVDGNWAAVSPTRQAIFYVKSGAAFNIKDAAGTGAIDSSANPNVYGAVILTISGDNDETKNAELIVDGGTLKGYYYGIVTNGSRPNTAITINGGTITAGSETDGTSIYHPNAGTLVINGGTLQGYDGLAVKGGTNVTITGGTFIATGSRVDPASPAESGCSAVGSALYIEGNYGSGAKVTVSGGTFKVTDSKAPAVRVLFNEKPKATLEITGGMYSNKPEDAYIADGYEATQSGDMWFVAKTDYSKKYGKYFSGGKGTVEEPFLIANGEQLQSISTVFADDAAPAFCYKVKDGVTSIDCTGWESVNLYGSFDGNGVTFENVGNELFGYLCKPSGMSQANLSNFIVNARSYVSSWHFGPVAYMIYGGAAELKDITVHGYIEAPTAAAFVSYGYSSVTELKFTNCYSDAALAGVSGGTGGFIAHPYGTQKVVLTDCLFAGTMASNGQPMGYVNRNYCNGTEYNYSQEFLTAHGFTSADDVKAKYYNTFDGSNVNGYLYTAEGKTSTLSNGAGTLPELGSAFTVSAAEGAASAMIYLQASPNKPADETHETEWGNFTTIYMQEELTPSSGTFTSSNVKYYNVRLNPTENPAPSTGVNGKNFDIINTNYGKTLFSKPIVKLIQYNSAGCIINITDWTLESTSYQGQ